MPASMPILPELAKANIDIDGFVLCPHTNSEMYQNWGTKCGRKKNVEGRPGQYTCSLCGKAFLAVAADITP